MTPDDRLHGALQDRAARSKDKGVTDKSAVAAFEPGRGSLEWAVMFSALSLVVPVLGVVAIWFALRARRLQSSRWLLVLIASLWCIFLGVVVRIGLGLEIVP